MTGPLTDFQPVEVIETDELPTGVDETNHFSAPDEHEVTDVYTDDVIVLEDEDGND